jgi:putative intracellular protease/amidase
MKSLRSLLIATSNNNSGQASVKTGVWFEEFVTAYFILKDGGEYITVASPLGGQIPVDPESQYTDATTENNQRFVTDSQAMYHFGHALPLNEIKPESFDLIFLAGGYGAMWDFPSDKNLNHIISHFIQENKTVGLVGHAPVALISLTTANKEPFVKGKKITAFSNSEEQSTGLDEISPFLLESVLVSLGAHYSKGNDFASYTVTDGNLITGQNPASTAQTARQTLSCAHEREKILQIEIN